MTQVTFTKWLRRSLFCAGAVIALSGCSFNYFSSGEPAEQETPQQDARAADLNAAQPGKIVSIEPEAPVAEPEQTLAPLTAAPAPALKPVAPPPPPEPKSGVEVVFQVPLQPVQYYHFYYGTDAGNLDRHLRVPVEKLEKLDDPVYGPVYRYVLREAPANKEVFVALRAENQNGLSDPTPPMSIPPRAK